MKERLSRAPLHYWILLCVGLAAVLVLGVWIASLHRKAAHEISEAKHFCEILIPAIEATRIMNGSYPESPDPTWWKGTEVPALIDLDYLYKSWGRQSGNAREFYHLQFTKPYSFGTSSVIYYSGTRSWSENDTNRSKKGWTRTFTTP